MAGRSIDSDCVDDSEPERKRIRLQKRRTRQKHQPQNNVVTCGSSPFSRLPASGNTIERLDGVAAEDTPDYMESAVIDAIDDTKRSCSKLPSESLPPVFPENSRPRAARDSSQQLIPGSDVVGTLETSPESNVITRLGHLAYRQVGPASNHVSDSSRAGRSQSAPVSVIHQDKVERLSQRSQSDPNVTKLDVGPLLRCVSCDIQWTVRKNAAHKSSHMATCARRKGMTPSTLQRVVERELLKLRQQKTKDQKPPCSEPPDAVPQTYMESVVAEAQPRRKQRRTDTVGTLQPVSQTRAAILDRAKALLGTRDAVPCNAPEPEDTESFGRSKLLTGYMQAENVDPVLVHLSDECALTSRLALLRSMAESPSTV